MRKVIEHGVNKAVEDVAEIYASEAADMIGAYNEHQSEIVKLKHVVKEMKEQADTNKDGIVSPKEAIDYGMELFNGNGVLLIFGIMLCTIMSAAFMLIRGIIDMDIFLLILQITTPTTLLSYITKVIVERLGTKTGKIMKEKNDLQIERDQLYLALELKKAHMNEYKD